MDRNVIVVDNFLDDPDRIRNIALSFDYSNVQNNVPGVRSSSRAGGEYEDKVTEKFREIFNFVFNYVQRERRVGYIKILLLNGQQYYILLLMPHLILGLVYMRVQTVI